MTIPAPNAANPPSILRQRMQTLAQPLGNDETQDSLEIVVFSLGDKVQRKEYPNDESALDSSPANQKSVLSTSHFSSGQYAFETAQVREVFLVTDASQIAKLPGTPPWVRGILNVRGHILAVLDLQKLFGLPEPETVFEAPVLIVRGDVVTETALAVKQEGSGADNAVRLEPVAVGDVALATTGVAGVQLLPRTQLETGHALEGTPGASYLRGLTQNGIALLDASLLLSDVKLVVHAE